MADARKHQLRRSGQDLTSAKEVPDTLQTRAEAYKLAFVDSNFLTCDDLRPVRLQLNW